MDRRWMLRSLMVLALSLVALLAHADDAKPVEYTVAPRCPRITLNQGLAWWPGPCTQRRGADMTMATRPRTRSDYQRAVERSRADTLPAIAVTRTPTTIPAPASAKRRIALSALDDDDRALLALVDGKRTVGSIIEWTGQTASKVGARLLRLGVIAF